MKDPEKLLSEARERASRAGSPFYGALPPQDAFELWRGDRGAILVDVRTRPEWNYVGRVPGAVEIEWNQYPSGRNPRFAEELEADFGIGHATLQIEAGPAEACRLASADTL